MSKLDSAYRRDSKRKRKIRVKIFDKVSLEDIIKDNKKRKLRKKRRQRIQLKENLNDNSY